VGSCDHGNERSCSVKNGELTALAYSPLDFKGLFSVELNFVSLPQNSSVGSNAFQILLDREAISIRTMYGADGAGKGKINSYPMKTQYLRLKNK
jgi:hypothetical protein